MNNNADILINIPIINVKIKKYILITYLLCTIHNISFFTQIIGMPYISKRLNINDTLYGHSQTFFGILTIIGGPIYGFLMKKLGIKYGLYIVYSMTMLMALILICFYNVYGLFISKIPGILIHGMQAHQAMLAILTEPGKERTTAFGKIGLCFGLSFVIAPIINNISSIFFNHFASLYSSIFLSILNIYLASILIDENIFNNKINDNISKEKNSNNDNVDDNVDVNDDEINKMTKIEKSKKLSLKTIYEISKKDNVLSIFLQKNIAVSPMHIPFSILQLYLIEKFNVTETINSFIQMIVGVLIMIVNGIGIPFLRNKFNEYKLILFGIICLIIVHSQLMTFVNLYQLYCILPFVALGMTLVNTVSDSILTASVDQDEQSIILGICTAAASTGRTIAPSIGGYILDKYDFSTIGYVGMISSLIALGIAVLFPPKNLKNNDESSQDSKDD